MYKLDNYREPGFIPGTYVLFLGFRESPSSTNRNSKVLSAFFRTEAKLLVSESDRWPTFNFHDNHRFS